MAKQRLSPLADCIQNSGGRTESKPCFNQNHRKQSNSISF